MSILQEYEGEFVAVHRGRIVSFSLNQLAFVFGSDKVDGQRYFWKMRMRLSRHLDDDHHVTRFKRFIPSRVDRIPTPRTARKFSAFSGEPDIRRPFVAGDELNGKTKRGFRFKFVIRLL